MDGSLSQTCVNNKQGKQNRISGKHAKCDAAVFVVVFDLMGSISKEEDLIYVAL